VESFVRARGLSGFTECVRALGGNPASILRLAGIDPRQLNDPLAWVPFKANLRAYQLATHSLKVPDFGVTMSRSRDFSHMGPLLLVARHAPDLKSAMEAISRYLSIQNTGYRTNVVMRGRTGVRAYYMNADMRIGADQWIEESLLSSKRLMSHFLGEDLPVVRILMRHKPVRPESAYQSDYGAPVLFEQDVDGVEVEEKTFKRALPTRDDAIEQFVTSYLEDRVQSFDGDVVLAARSLLETLIPMSQGSLEIVAGHLRLNPRTLQRRLKDQGYSFSELVEDQRRTMADRLLREGNLPLVKVANYLGYSEQSSFNHAFERWYGKSPLAWLRRHR